MKVIAKTTRNIELLDIQAGDVVKETPAVVSWTQFKEARTGKGQVKILASDLPDTATDEEFQKYLKDAGDVELAVAAFVSAFEEKPEKEAEAPKKTRRKAPAQKAEE